MKYIKIDQENLNNAVKSGLTYIEVANKKFMLMEIEEVNSVESYLVTDPVEESKLLEALNDYNPILSNKEIDDI